MEALAMQTPDERPKGFLQLCADKRYHRKTMKAFENVTGLGEEDYWIEASAGGAPAFGYKTKTAEFAYENGAVHMGWAAHGDECGGFPGATDQEIAAKLDAILVQREINFPAATHYLFFGASGIVVQVVPGD